MLKLVVVLVATSYVNGLFLRTPCDLTPATHGKPQEPGITVDTYVPDRCVNGTFRWGVPKGHARLHFSNPKHLETTVCFGDSLLGTVLSIVDLTAQKEHQLGTFSMDKIVCSGSTTASDVIMRVDAPENLRYIAEVAFYVKHA